MPDIQLLLSVYFPFQAPKYVTDRQYVQTVSCGDTIFPLRTYDVNVSLGTDLQWLNYVSPISQEEAEDLEKGTVRQSDCTEWYVERKDRITASLFGKIVKRKKEVSARAIFKFNF